MIKSLLLLLLGTVLISSAVVDKTTTHLLHSAKQNIAEKARSISTVAPQAGVSQADTPGAVSQSLDSSITHSLTPVPSNQWYSTIAFQFPTAPIYALPLVFKLSSSGIGISYPSVTPSPQTISASYAEDFTVGENATYQKPKITSLGDWSIGVNLPSNKNSSLSFTMAHGVPYTVIHTDSAQVNFTFTNSFVLSDHNSKDISSGSMTTDIFVLHTNNHYYLVSLSQPTTIDVNAKTISLKNPQRIFLALLDKKEHYDLFKSISGNEIVTTYVTPNISGNALQNHYSVVTTGGAPLLALYPHQADFLTGNLTSVGAYNSLRGPLKLYQTNIFTTKQPLLVPSASFPSLSPVPDELKNSLKNDIAQTISAGPPQSKDYFLAVWLGKVSSLMQLADMAGLSDERKKLQDFVTPIFLDRIQDFTYNQQKTSIIATSPEFGNENLNDHHFHYGYFLRTAAVLVHYDPTLLGKIQPYITPMQDDIATIDRKSDKFPFLRNFDAYEAHSWADGEGNFADGNNQESSSEAINAWYGLYLWSQVTNDNNLKNYALYLYNMEITGTRYYWFDVKHMYTAPYDHAIASLVWGGKVDFATWFSPNTNMKYGIELLPFTPGSVYLGKLPDFSRYDSDYHKSGGSETDPWGDLFVMWESFYDPQKAMSFKDTATKREDSNTRSLFLYFLYANSQHKLD